MEHQISMEIKSMAPFMANQLEVFKFGEFSDGYHFEFTFSSSHGDELKIIDVKYYFE